MSAVLDEPVPVPPLEAVENVDGEVLVVVPVLPSRPVTFGPEGDAMVRLSWVGGGRVYGCPPHLLLAAAARGRLLVVEADPATGPVHEAWVAPDAR